MHLVINSHSPAETADLGWFLGARLWAGAFVALMGDLGAGKTCLAKGLLHGLGVARPGGSPTFTILQEYQGRLPVYHFDVYRLDDPPAELAALGYEEYFFGDGVTLVEWADRVRALWPPERLAVDLSPGPGDEERQIALDAAGRRYAALLKELADAGLGL